MSLWHIFSDSWAFLFIYSTCKCFWKSHLLFFINLEKSASFQYDCNRPILAVVEPYRQGCYPMSFTILVSWLIISVYQTRFYLLCQLSTIRNCLTPEMTRTLVQAFIVGRLDCCNSIFVGISDQLLQRLQLIQNASTCLVTGARKYDHISPTLRELHWLPVRQRISFKLAVLMFKCLHDLAPPYLATYCTTTSSTAGCSHLHSARSRHG